MRILLATNHAFLPQRTGGSESMMHEVCLALKARGFPVGVLCSLGSDGFVGLTNRVKRKLYPARQFPSDETMGYPVYRGWEAVDGVLEVIQSFAPTVVIVQAGAPMTLVRAFMKAGIPTVLYIHDVNFDKFGGDVARAPLLLCIANSSFTASRFRARFGIVPYVIPPCVDQDRYKVATSRTKVLFVGLVPEKGVELAFRLAERRPDIRFEFVESWPINKIDFANYKRRAERLGNVIVRRRVADMKRVYNVAKVVLVPSVCEEAWGRVCTEAQCSGVPVLASKIGGLPESVGPGGVLVDVHAPLREWLAALSSLWDDEGVYVRLSKAAFVHSRRSEIQFTHVIDKLISLLARHSSSLSTPGDP